LLVGLTGGIGSGKSTVARMLVDMGAVVIDADVLARKAIDPGTTGRGRVAETFPDVVDASGDIDREALGARVFADDQARRTLESIVWPEVFRLMNEELDRYRQGDRIVVFDAPLIVEAGAREGFDVLVVVSASEDQQVDRLLRDRTMTEASARERIAAQLPLHEKEALADIVIRNDGSIDDLRPQVERLWGELQARAAMRR
jgi:dephospho-CoA kinase